jgi:hypothetical protein
VVDGTARAEKICDAVVIADVRGDAFNAELVGSGLQAFGAARSDDDIRALRLRLFGNGETYARGSPDDDNLVPGKRRAATPFSSLRALNHAVRFATNSARGFHSMKGSAHTRRRNCPASQTT